MFILEQLCNLICPSKSELVYLLVLNKAQMQEEFIRGSMKKNPYSSAEIGSLMRDVKKTIFHQLDLLGLVEDDYGISGEASFFDRGHYFIKKNLEKIMQNEIT